MPGALHDTHKSVRVRAVLQYLAYICPLFKTRKQLKLFFIFGNIY